MQGNITDWGKEVTVYVGTESLLHRNAPGRSGT